MAKRLLRVALLGGCLIGIAWFAGYVGYIVGGRIGFVEGFAAGSVSAHTNSAAFTTLALTALRRGEISRGIESLEQDVDSGIMSYWGYLHDGDSEFDKTGVVAKSHEVMIKVADYRDAHPPVSEDPDVLSAINEALDHARGSR